MLDPEQNPDDFYEAYMNKDQADWDKIYKNYTAAVDWPTVSFYKELFAKYPNAKVLLTVRSADSWYKSAKNTIHQSNLQVKNVKPGDPMYKFFRMASTVVLDGSLANEEAFADEEAIKKLFLDHIEEVKRVIPKDQLLVMELGEGWERLCKFLGKEVPNEPYPKVNNTEQFNKEIGNGSKFGVV
jgi:hypothetical protein